MASNQNIRINIDLVGNASKAKAAINQVQSALNGLNTDKLGKGVGNTVSKLQSEISKFEETAYKGTADTKDLSSMTRNIESIIGLTNKLQTELSNATGKEINLIPDSDLQLFQKLNNEVKNYNAEISKSEKILANLEKDQSKNINKRAIAKQNLRRDFLGKTLNDTRANELDAERALKLASLKTLSKKQDTKGLDEQETASLEKIKSELQAINAEREKIYSKKELFDSKSYKDLQNANQELKSIQETINKIAQESTAKLQSVAKVIQEVTGQDMSKVTSIEQITQVINSLEADKVEQIRTKLLEAASGMEQLGSEAGNTKGQLSDYATEIDKVSYSAQQMAQLKNQVLSFFSVGNGIQLFKRMVRSAVDTISDLDKAMTETAVVTDFSVSDMWSRLREYTDLANELGATTQGAYETMTLYYQQGLDTKASFELGEETMKMARIAGMDYTEATDMMTAALRGFNMELNATSAKHINDVYSELAAITASDTYEISEAMTRTASIAASAGLDFDIASAYLAEAIETTREAPENIGTAMKTIVARFAGLTKDPAELSQDMRDALEGEVVEANRVEAALRSAGVQARDSNGEFRNLSDVFLELNAKWDSLDLMTQRYVATQAAGTRQQSRFIAMMQNYDRTMELVNAAQNSAGASQRQFEKTLDSMEAKVNRLKNAWNEFIMNITNSDMVKAGIDALTGFLNVLNQIGEKLTKLVPGQFFDGIAKSLLNISMIIASMKIGGSILNGDIFRGAIGKDRKQNKWGLSGINENFNKGWEEQKKQKTFNWTEGTNISSEAIKQGKDFTSTLSRTLTNNSNLKIANKELTKNLLKITPENAREFTQSLINTSNTAIAKVLGSMKNQKLPNMFVEDFKSQINYDGLNEAGKSMADKTINGFLEQTKNGDWRGLEDFTKVANQLNTGKTYNPGKTLPDQSKIAPLAQGLQTISTNAQMAGSSLMGMGQALSAAGFEKTATVCYLLGSALNGIGAAATGAAALVQKLSFVLQGETAATLASAIAEKAKNTAQAASIIIKGGLAGVTEVLAAAEMAEATGAEAATVAQWQLNAAMLANPVGFFIAAIVALTAALAGLTVGAVKAYQAISGKLDGSTELEKTSAAATQAQAVLNETQNAYNKLHEGAINLEELQNGFDGLVEGTNAWNEQMLKTNDSIIKLCDQFPKLLKYTETLSNGLMEIKPEGLEEVLKQQQKALANASALSSIASGREAKAQSKVDSIQEFNNLSSKTVDKTDIERIKNIQEQGMQEYLSSLELGMSTIVATTDGVSDKYSEGISQILANQYENSVNAQLEEMRGFDGKSRKDIKKAWAKANGWTWKEKNTYTNDATGAEQEFDWKTVKQGYADTKALEQASKSAEELSAQLTRADLSASKLFKNLKGADNTNVFSKLLSKDSTIDADTINKLQKDKNVDKLVNKYRKSVGDKEFAKALSNYLGVNLDEVEGDLDKYEKQLKKTLKNNVDDIQKAQAEQAKELATLLAFTQDRKDNQGFNKKLNKSNEKRIAKFIDNLNTQQREFLSSTASQINNALGRDATNTFLDTMQEMYQKTRGDEGNRALIEAQEWISTIDWNNPITAAEMLSEGLDSNNKKIKEFSKNILDAGDDCISAARQVQYFLTSADYEELSEDVQDFIDTNGEVTADNIREMANENSALRTVMENTNTSATTMAMLFTKLGKDGSFAITSITDTLLNLLSGFGQLEDTIADTINELENFNPGIDEGAAADALGEWVEAINGFWQNGEYGNSQLQNYLKKVFGGDVWDQAVSEANGNIAEAEAKLVDRVQKFGGGDLSAAWMDLANNSSAQKALEKYRISVKQTAEGISVTDLGGDKLTHTTKELIAAIADAYKVDPTTAAAMVADIKNFSADAAQELQAADIKASVIGKNSKFAQSLETQFTNSHNSLVKGNKILASDLRNTAEILNSTSNFGKTDQIEYWNSVIKNLGLDEDLTKQINIESYITKKGDMDIDKLLKDLEKLDSNSMHKVIIDPQIDKNGNIKVGNFIKQLNQWSKGNGGEEHWLSNFANSRGVVNATDAARQLREEFSLTDDQIQQVLENRSEKGWEFDVKPEVALDNLNMEDQIDEYRPMGKAIAQELIQGIKDELTSTGIGGFINSLFEPYTVNAEEAGTTAGLRFKLGFFKVLKVVFSGAGLIGIFTIFWKTLKKIGQKLGITSSKSSAFSKVGKGIVKGIISGIKKGSKAILKAIQGIFKPISKILEKTLGKTNFGKTISKTIGKKSKIPKEKTTYATRGKDGKLHYATGEKKGQYVSKSDKNVKEITKEEAKQLKQRKERNKKFLKSTEKEKKTQQKKTKNIERKSISQKAKEITKSKTSNIKTGTKEKISTVSGKGKGLLSKIGNKPTNNLEKFISGKKGNLSKLAPASKGLLRGLGAVGTAVTVAEGVKNYSKAKTTKGKGKAIGQTGGTLAGAALGAKLGATAGTFVGGPVGTAVGGLVGGGIGAIAGSKAGRFLGGYAVSKGKQAKNFVFGNKKTGEKDIFGKIASKGKSIKDFVFGNKKTGQKSLAGKVLDFQGKWNKNKAIGKDGDQKGLTGAINNLISALNANTRALGGKPAETKTTKGNQISSKLKSIGSIGKNVLGNVGKNILKFNPIGKSLKTLNLGKNLLGKIKLPSLKNLFGKGKGSGQTVKVNKVTGLKSAVKTGLAKVNPKLKIEKVSVKSLKSKVQETVDKAKPKLTINKVKTSGIKKQINEAVSNLEPKLKIKVTTSGIKNLPQQATTIKESFDKIKGIKSFDRHITVTTAGTSQVKTIADSLSKLKSIGQGDFSKTVKVDTPGVDKLPDKVKTIKTALQDVNTLNDVKKSLTVDVSGQKKAKTAANALAKAASVGDNLNKTITVNLKKPDNFADDIKEIKKGFKEVNKIKNVSKTVDIKVSGQKKVQTAAKNYNKLSEEPNKLNKTATVKVDASGVKKQTNKATKAFDEINKIKDVTKKITIQTSGVNKAAAAAKNLTQLNKIGNINKTLKINNSAAISKINAVKKKWSSWSPGTKKLNIKVTKVNKTITISGSAKGSVRIKTTAKGKNTTKKSKGSTPKGKKRRTSGASGQNLGSAAQGAQRGKLGPRGKGGPTLTGELGQEMVWEPDTSSSYLVGTNGPEVVDLPKNAVVWPHNQTEQILKGENHKELNSNAFGSAFTGYGNPFGSGSVDGNTKTTTTKTTSSKKSKKKNKKSNDKWENPYDKYYNLQRKITKEIRVREQLENRYNRMLKQRNSSIKDLTKNIEEQIATLAQTIKDAKSMMTKKEAQAEKVEDKVITAGYSKSSKGKYVKKDDGGYRKATKKELKNSKIQKYKKNAGAIQKNLSDYAYWDEESHRVIINQSKIQQIETNSKKKGTTGKYWAAFGKKVEKWISELEEYQDAYEEAEDALEDAIDDLVEMESEALTTIADLDGQIRDAIIDLRQQEIDKLSDVNDSINTANDRILKSINKAVNKLRRDRDNKETETDLAEKERRLAYLKQDTSGANALEIKQLEEEIKNAKQDYQDELVDQAIEDFEDANEEASEQRERMIELLEDKLDADQMNGVINSMIERLKNESIIDGEFSEDSNLGKLFKNTTNYLRGTDNERTKQLNDIISAIKAAYVAQTITLPQVAIQNALNSSRENGGKPANIAGATDSSGSAKGVQAVAGSSGNYLLQDGKAYSTDALTQDSSGNWNLDTSQTYQRTGADMGIDGTVDDERFGFVTADGQERWGQLDTKNNTITVGNTTYKDIKEVGEGDNVSIVSSTKTFGNGKAPWDYTSTGKMWNNNTYKRIASAQYLYRDLGYSSDVSGKLNGVKTFKNYASKAGLTISSGSAKKNKKDKKKTAYIKGASYLNQFKTLQGKTIGNDGKIYKTGGLADYTGPAWIDGTPSKPELVLNAKDTSNFIQLKDILADIMKNNGISTNTANTTTTNDTFNISVNVDSIANDYDVSKLVTQIKKEITKESKYRNVNQLHRLR